MQSTTLITGAGVRLGAQLARHLAARGQHLVLHYRASGAEAEALAAELRAQHGVTVTLLQADLEQAGDVARFWQGLPPVTHLIHSASLYVRDSFTSFTGDTLRRQLAVNFEVPLLLSQGFLAQLPAEASGTVTVLGDGLQGWSVSPEFFSYAVGKQAWLSVIDLLAAGLAPRARANLIALGPTLPGTNDPDGLFERLAARAPLKRHSAPDELCRTLDYLLESPSVTGQILSLSSGFNLLTARPVNG